MRAFDFSIAGTSVIDGGEGVAVCARMRRGVGNGDFMVGLILSFAAGVAIAAALLSPSELRASRMLAGISVRIELMRASNVSPVLFVGLAAAIRFDVDASSVAVFRRMIFTGVLVGLRSVTSSNRCRDFAGIEGVAFEASMLVHMVLPSSSIVGSATTVDSRLRVE